jgi:hypothetical protein
MDSRSLRIRARKVLDNGELPKLHCLPDIITKKETENKCRTHEESD